jgi:hypothetical protein
MRNSDYAALTARLAVLEVAVFGRPMGPVVPARPATPEAEPTADDQARHDDLVAALRAIEPPGCLVGLSQRQIVRRAREGGIRAGNVALHAAVRTLLGLYGVRGYDDPRGA